MPFKFGLSVAIMSAVFVSQLILEIERANGRNEDDARNRL